MTEDKRTVRIRVSGRVQGVWYRGWCVREANRLGLNGWVRNCADGSVEALLHGTDELIDDMVRKCWDGPGGARVEAIDITNVAEIPKDGFHQAPSA